RSPRGHPAEVLRLVAPLTENRGGFGPTLPGSRGRKSETPAVSPPWAPRAGGRLAVRFRGVRQQNARRRQAPRPGARGLLPRAPRQVLSGGAARGRRPPPQR